MLHKMYILGINKAERLPGFITHNELNIEK